MMNGASTRPNVLVILTDQQRADTTGIHGNPLGLTPNLDAMAGRGTHLTRMYSCQPLCGPARSVIQTGQYATTTGCYINGIPLPAESQTLAHHFRAAGYNTAYIGKWHLATDEPVPSDQQGGYDYWMAANILELCSQPYSTVLFDKEGRRHKLPGYRTDAVTDAAIGYLRNCGQSEPFFLFLSLLEPHHQNDQESYPPPDSLLGRYGGRWLPPDLAALPGTAHQHADGYFGMVKRIDEAFGRLLDALRSLNFLDNTIVAFTSDHGCHFHTRDGVYKRTCHESSTHVPAVFAGPGFGGRGQHSELISLVDFAPTLLDAADINVPPSMEGRSFMPHLRDASIAWDNEVFIQTSETEIGRAIRTQRWKYGVKARHSDGWKHPAAELYFEDCLYDMANDPYELNNLVRRPSHQGIRDQLREKLVDRIRTVEGICPRIEVVDAESRR